MAKKIMYAKSNVEGNKKKKIYCGDLDKNDYETKYKGHLTCIKGCPAKIKFTERKIMLNSLAHGIKRGTYIKKVALIMLIIREKWEEKSLVLIMKA